MFDFLCMELGHKNNNINKNSKIEEFMKNNPILYSPEGLHVLLCETLLYSSVSLGIISSLPRL